MKIIVELISVRQEWDPDTNTHSNSVIFGFGGLEVQVPATPEQVKEIILAARDADPVGDQPERVSRARIHAAQVLSQAGRTSEALETLGFDAADLEPDDTNYRAEEMSPEMEDAIAAELTTGDESIFGGDYDPERPLEEPPVIFQQQAAAPAMTATQQREASIEARRSVDPAQARKQEKAAMRERARRVPQRKVEKDEMGYPVVHQGKSITGSAGSPEVVVRAPVPTMSTGGDDDGFGQG